MSKIGDNILAARKRAGLTQEELAAKMGYKSKSTINKIELGVNDIPQSKIVKFAEVLGTTPAVLMGWVSPETSQKNDKIVVLINRMRKDTDFLDAVHELSFLDSEGFDDLVVLINKMRKDPEFFEVVSSLAELPADQYASVKSIIAALGTK